jgi:hypothetical protein
MRREVRWERMFPDELEKASEVFPVVFMPLEMASTFPHVLANNFTHPVKKIISPFLTIFYMTPHSGRTHEHGVITDLATPLS